MKIFTIAFSLLLTQYALHAQETFSIVAVDPATREVGSAGASCAQGAAQFGGVILISEIVPGRGGVNAQAYVCVNPNVNLVAAIQRMKEGMSPVQIIDWLKTNDGCFSQNFNPEYRQYGIVDFDSSGNPRAAAFTGANADNWKGHKTGPNYSIQGNILIGPQVLDSIEARFIRATGTLADRMMYALQGANFPGADARCLNDGTSSTSAFLQVYKSTDAEGQPYLRLNVAETPKGVEPIDSLQKLFNLYKATTGVRDKEVLREVHSGSRNAIVRWAGDIKIMNGFTHCTILDLNGRMMLESTLNPNDSRVDISHFTPGTYVLILSHEGKVLHQKLIVLK